MRRPPTCNRMGNYAVDMTCGGPSTHFYLYEMERGGRNSFSRCETHRIRTFETSIDFKTPGTFEEVTYEEFLVSSVLDS